MCHETCARGSPLPVRLAHVHAFFPGLALATLLLGRASHPFRFSGLHLRGSHLVLVCRSRGFCRFVFYLTHCLRAGVPRTLFSFPAFTCVAPTSCWSARSRGFYPFGYYFTHWLSTMGSSLRHSFSPMCEKQMLCIFMLCPPLSKASVGTLQVR